MPHTGSHKQHEPVNKFPKVGWASVTFLSKLGSVNTRPVGSSSRAWLPVRPGENSTSGLGSSFTRLASWCQQRGKNSLCGPIADIVNFLADLFSQGYQYYSLNYYQSAISSVHEAVNGGERRGASCSYKTFKGRF